ncbi:MAG: aminoacyl-tRNA hydrolase [Phycisphaerae bacterium]|nr:aminoacyl-tRNA hydrolase [Phycisphaerae bacterium]
MRVVVGLGNPGREYDKTRHNAGFMVVDRLVDRHARAVPARARFNAAAFDGRIAGEPCLFLKPTTYMNRSGLCVGEAVRFFKLNPAQELLVIVDEIYLPCGTIRLRPGGGSGGHNGLEDIGRALGTDAYPRLRVGVGPKPPGYDQSNFVLGRFTDLEWAAVAPSIDKAADAAECFVTKGLDAAMNAFNAPDVPRPARPKPERPESDPARIPPEAPPPA